MTSFAYTINDPMGLHARPVGLMVKIISQKKDKVTVRFKDKEADGRRLYQVLSLGAKQGDKIELVIEGEEEENTAQELQHMFQAENL